MNVCKLSACICYACFVGSICEVWFTVALRNEMFGSSDDVRI